ncbi:MAG TPA: AraC family transcriptional regulator [Alloacidobacterium sp.]|jgi:AraC-like DNA-binding protein/mannose-6-phosphate isomerase-like protein (cupin superfamily)|nr:AraC family transcriptional regulator [Alloacidobacterium sp.]
MAKLQRSFPSSADPNPHEVVVTRRGHTGLARRIKLPNASCCDHFDLVEPNINAEGTHIWPFDQSFPLDMIFLTADDRRRVRMNRHGYFEVLFLCSGSANCHIQDRLLPFNEGDLAIIGSTLYHRIESQSSSPLTIAALFFEPDLIRCDGASDSVHYLMPFLLQDENFPHVIPGESGVPRQVLDLMLRIRSEMPATSARARLAVKTYLKMLLMLLVNQYTPYAGTVETYQRQQQNIERLRPLFRYLGDNCADSIQVRQAARICGMSESHFMSLFKHVTGLSFVTYLNHFRIEQAQCLLIKTDDSMSTISQQVGFCDQSYFGTVFRRIVGMTPATYRRRMRNNPLGDQQPQPYHMPRLPAAGRMTDLASRNANTDRHHRLGPGR